jgi:hypothetical protein
MLNPEHHVLRRIHQFSSYVVAIANSGQRRTDQPSRSRHPGNAVARIAPVLANLDPSRACIAAGQLCSLQFLLVTQVVTARDAEDHQGH